MRDEVFDWEVPVQTGLTTVYSVRRQHGAKTQVNLQCREFDCLLHTTVVSLN